MQDWNRYFLLESTYVKNIKRNSLHIPTLDYLIEIFVEGPPLGIFSADLAIDLWLNDSSIAR